MFFSKIPEQLHFELRARRLPEQGPVMHSSSFWRKKHFFAPTCYEMCASSLNILYRQELFWAEQRGGKLH